MLYLLDTNALVELRRKHPILIANLKQHAPASICYSVISIGEIHKGIVQHPLEQGAAMWGHWKLLLAPFAAIDFTSEAAMIWGRLLHETRKQPVGPRDLLIAATALSCGMTVVTHNIREFNRIEGLPVEDWQVQVG
jgi:tRNA(fMet)-specific endonuclease VapC